MKKHILTFCILSAAALFMAACTTDAGSPVPASDNGGSLSFVLKGLNSGLTTYAETPIATNPEWEVRDMDIYMFEYDPAATGTFIAKFTSADYSLSLSGSDRLLTLQPLNSYTATGKTFYFVANPSPTTNLTAVADVTTEADFRELLTAAQSLDVDGKAALLTTPLLFAGRAANVDPSGTGVTPDVDMIRRVARFDIVNEYPDFVIEKVFVSDANIDGNIFGNATGTPTYASASLAEIAVDDTKYAAVDGNRQLRSVFYTYPTTLGTGKTEIAIQASLNGEGSTLYYVELAADVEVKANYRYILVVDESITYGVVKFNLHFLDWKDDGTEFDLETKRPMEIGGFKTSVAGDLTSQWDEPTMTYDLGGNSSTTFSFVVENTLEIEEEFTLLNGAWTDVTGGKVNFSKKKVFTYGAEVYHNYTVTLPTQAAAESYFAIQMRLSNKGDATDYKDLYLVLEDGPIRLKYTYLNRGWLGWGATNLVSSVVPDGMRVYALEDLPSSYDYPDGTATYTPVASADAGNVYDTGETTATSSWTFVSVSNNQDLDWTDENPGDGTSNLNNLYLSLPSSSAYPGCYAPFHGLALWQLNTYAQGVPYSQPETVDLARMNFTATFTLTNAGNLPQLVDSGDPPVIDLAKVWVKFDKLPLSVSLGTGAAAFDHPTAPAYGAVAVDGFTGSETLTSPTVSMFGTASPSTNPDFVRPVLSLMYDTKTLISCSFGVLSNYHHDITINLNDIVNVKVTVESPGLWTSIDVSPVF